MENFFGIFHRDGRPLQLNGISSEVSQSGKISIAFIGILFEPETWATQFALNPRELSSAQLFLFAFERWGREAFNRVNGEYSCVIWDKEKHELLLVRDRIGVHPIYFAETPNSIIFGSTIKLLLTQSEVSRRPNLERLEQYGLSEIQSNWQPEATCFDQVFRVRPSHAVLFSKSGCEKFQYWDFQIDSSLSNLSLEDATSAFRDYYARAVKRRVQVKDGVAVALSGGLDSSSMFARAIQQGTNCLGISLGHPAFRTADESQFLRDVQKFLECNVRTILSEDYSFALEHLQKGILQTETPRYDTGWYAWSAVCEAARQSGRKVLLSGHWGDQFLFSPHYLVDLFQHFQWPTIAQHLRSFRQWFTAEESRALRSEFFKQSLKSLVPSPLISLLRAVLRRKGSRLPRFGHSAYSHWLFHSVREPAQIETMEWFQKLGMENGIEFRFPMLDADLIRLLLSLPGELQNSGGVPRYLLRESMKYELPQSVLTRHWKWERDAIWQPVLQKEMDQMVSRLERESWLLNLKLVTESQLKKRLTRWKSQRYLKSSTTYDCLDWFGVETWCSLFLGESR